MARTIAALVLTAAVSFLGCPVRKAPETAAAPSAEAAPVDTSPTGRAITLYDEGRYDEAQPLLEALEAEGKMTGPLLYRLGYVQGAGNRQNELMQRALTELEKEVADGRQPRGQLLPRQRADQNSAAGAMRDIVAVDDDDRVKRGEWPSPASGVDQFRMAKLLARTKER